MGVVSHNGHVAHVDFEADIDRYLDDCEAEGISPEMPYSGTTLVRISPSLHAAVAADAAYLGWSIKQWVEFAISKTLDEAPDRDGRGWMV